MNFYFFLRNRVGKYVIIYGINYFILWLRWRRLKFLLQRNAQCSKSDFTRTRHSNFRMNREEYCTMKYGNHSSACLFSFVHPKRILLPDEVCSVVICHNSFVYRNLCAVTEGSMDCAIWCNKILYIFFMKCIAPRLRLWLCPLLLYFLQQWYEVTLKMEVKFHEKNYCSWLYSTLVQLLQRSNIASLPHQYE